MQAILLKQVLPIITITRMMNCLHPLSDTSVFCTENLAQARTSYMVIRGTPRLNWRFSDYTRSQEIISTSNWLDSLSRREATLKAPMEIIFTLQNPKPGAKESTRCQLTIRKDLVTSRTLTSYGPTPIDCIADLNKVSASACTNHRARDNRRPFRTSHVSFDSRSRLGSFE